MPGGGVPSVGDPTREEWRALYDAARAYRERRPWQWLSDEHIFGVQNPETGEIGWVCVFGAAGEIFGAFIYAGSEGLAGYLAMAAGRVDADEALFSQRGWLVSFENRSGLDATDRKVADDVGPAPRGRKAWPRFRSYRPGFFPWYLAAPEARFLTLALAQAADVAERFGGDPGALAPSADGRYVARVPEARGGVLTWADRRVAPPPPPPEGPAPPPLDEVRLRRIADRVPAGAATWECDYFFTPFPTAEGRGRPVYPPAVMVVDARSGLILQLELSEPPLQAAVVRDRFLAAVEKAGMRPAAVHVDRPLVHDALAPVAAALGVRLERVRSLPALAHARRAMQDALASRR
jgi:hypothetical protein